MKYSIISIIIFSKWLFLHFPWGLSALFFLGVVLFLLLCVAILTLFERKVLGGMQRRRGPNAVGIFGFLQPIADAVKLLAKESVIPSASNYLIFAASPISMLVFSMACWGVIPLGEGAVISDISIGMMFIFALSSANVYSVIMAGWSSNSKYSFLGSLRSAAQMISYEVALGLVIMPVFVFSESANLTRIVFFQEELFNAAVLLPSFLLFFICVLAETSRVPFDLPEAESELVSGYNTEYSSVGFVLFFLSEYLNIILMSILIIILFFGGWLPFIEFPGTHFIPEVFWFSLKLFFLLYAFIWVRAVLPRFRYDQLMSLGWKVILPLAIAFLFLTTFWTFLFNGFAPFF